MIQQLKMLSLLIVLVLLQSCASNAPDDNQQEQNQSQQEMESSVAVQGEECESKQIPAAEAQPMIDSAKAYIDAINTTGEIGDISIPLGAEISDCMWQDIVAELGEKPRVWSMLAIDNGKLKVIFKGKSATGETYKYFNFTNPCPSNCPD